MPFNNDSVVYKIRNNYIITNCFISLLLNISAPTDGVLRRTLFNAHTTAQIPGNPHSLDDKTTVARVKALALPD